jgi:hypothetical protein
MNIMNAKEFFKSKYPEEGGYFACFHDEDMIEFAEDYRKHRNEAENLPISDVSNSVCDYCQGTQYDPYEYGAGIHVPCPRCC